MNDTEVPRRLDLHNTSIDFLTAMAGRCGFTHLDTGRICRLRHGHDGPCLLLSRGEEPADAASASLR
ncbi:MAG: hypothetical protein ACR2LI_15450 [Propionibacteriaceae bacterium]